MGEETETVRVTRGPRQQANGSSDCMLYSLRRAFAAFWSRTLNGVRCELRDDVQ